MTKPREFYIYEGESVTGEVLSIIRIIRDKDAGNLGPYWKDAIHAQEITEEPEVETQVSINCGTPTVIHEQEPAQADTGKVLQAMGTDARLWAQEFMETFKKHAGQPPEWLDEGLMIGWFANAIMAGYDNANWKHDEAQADRISIKKSLWDRMVVFINTNYNGNKECHMLCEDVQAAEREK